MFRPQLKKMSKIIVWLSRDKPIKKKLWLVDKTSTATHGLHINQVT